MAHWDQCETLVHVVIYLSSHKRQSAISHSSWRRYDLFGDLHVAQKCKLPNKIFTHVRLSLGIDRLSTQEGGSIEGVHTVMASCSGNLRHKIHLHILFIAVYHFRS